MKEKNTYHNVLTDKNSANSLRLNPFTVPPSYFEEFSSRINSQINLEKSGSKNGVFSVPLDYFDTLSSSILAQTKLDLLQKADSSTGTPEGYFDNLTTRVMATARIDSVSQNKESDFSIPEGYFQGLTERIKGSVFEHTLEQKVKTDGFGVPSHYFEDLTAKITQSISSVEKSSKSTPAVIPFNIQGWIKYAAAACVIAILGITSYDTITEHDNVDVTSSHLSSISEKEIINYLSSSTDSDDMLYIMEYLYHPTSSEGVGSKVEDDDIEDYLNYTL